MLTDVSVCGSLKAGKLLTLRALGIPLERENDFKCVCHIYMQLPILLWKVKQAERRGRAKSLPVIAHFWQMECGESVEDPLHSSIIKQD